MESYSWRHINFSSGMIFGMLGPRINLMLLVTALSPWNFKNCLDKNLG